MTTTTKPWRERLIETVLRHLNRSPVDSRQHEVLTVAHREFAREGPAGPVLAYLMTFDCINGDEESDLSALICEAVEAVDSDPLIRSDFRSLESFHGTWPDGRDSLPQGPAPVLVRLGPAP